MFHRGLQSGFFHREPRGLFWWRGCDATGTPDTAPGGRRAWGRSPPTPQYTPSRLAPLPSLSQGAGVQCQPNTSPRIFLASPSTPGCSRATSLPPPTTENASQPNPCASKLQLGCSAARYSSVNAIYLAIWYHGHLKCHRMELPKEIW